MHKYLISTGLASLLIGGCATVPTPLTGEYSPVTPTMVRERQSGIGQPVRWGGSVVAVKPYEKQTCLELLYRPLDGSARPKATDSNQGRFIACKAGFLDPADFDEGREVTVIGRISGVKTGKIGEYQYHYPTLDASTVYLWPLRQDYRDRYYYRGYDPFFYDPFFWPFPYPVGYYPPHYWPKAQEQGVKPGN